jgi:hypothetical protein
LKCLSGRQRPLNSIAHARPDKAARQYPGGLVVGVIDIPPAMQQQTDKQTYRARKLVEIAGAVPYGLGSRILSIVFGNPLIQALVFGKRRRFFARVHSLVGDAAHLRRDFTRHLLSSFTIPWRVNALSRYDEAAFRRWVRVEGESILDDLQSAGRPVLLVSFHTGISRLVPLVALRQGHRPVLIEPEPYLRIMGARGAERLESILLRGESAKFWMKELYQANKVMAGKGIVHLAMDGLQGGGGVNRPFLGRQRVFHVSLAQLALQQDAAIVLGYGTLDERGQVAIHFVGPVETGERGQSMEARVACFLDSYIGVIEDVWRHDLGNVAPRHLHQYLHAWPADAGGGAAASGARAAG